LTSGQAISSVVSDEGGEHVGGYVLADVTWSDEEGRSRYIELIGPSLIPYEGKVVAGSTDAEAVEGEWHPGEITVLISFPSRAAAQAWYSSHEYREALDIRKRSSDSRLLIFGT